MYESKLNTQAELAANVTPVASNTIMIKWENDKASTIRDFKIQRVLHELAQILDTTVHSRGIQEQVYLKGRFEIY